MRRLRAARPGRRRLNDCVFCSRAAQPAPLFEIGSVYAVPDKFPLTPGHTLVIAREHLACFGAGTEEVWRDLEESAAIARRFLSETYGRPLFVWENGVSGQSVFHAHLHLIPLPAAMGMRFSLPNDPALVPVSSWETVRSQYLRDSHYRYLELAGQRYVLPGYSPLLRALTGLLAESTGLRRGPEGWIKTTTSADVDGVATKWAAWSGNSERPEVISG